MVNETHLNMDTVEVLQEMDQGSGFFAELVGEYARQALDLLADITRGFEQRDEQAIRFAVHTLKGSSYNLGADNVAEVCVQIEAATAKADYAEIEALLPQLESTFRTAADALQRVV